MKAKRMLALLLAGLMCFALFTACGKKNEGAADNGGGEEASSENVAEITFPLEEKVEYSAWRTAATSDPKLGIVTYNDIEAVQAWEEKSNVHVEWQIPPSGQEQENFNLMITSGEYPDMIWDIGQYYVGGLDKAISDGVIVPLNKYMENHLKDYNALISSNDTVYKDCKTDEGNFAAVYFINTPDQGPWMGMAMRKDWLDELGLDVPVTYDDWHNVLTAFKEQKGATAPLWINASAGDPFNIFTAGYGTAVLGSSGAGFLNVDKKVQFGPIEEGYKEYITMLHDWYAEGLIDPDFYTRTDWLCPDTLYGQNITGAWADIYTLIGLRGAMSGNPDMDLVAVPAPVKNAGDKVHTAQYNFTRGTGTVAISTQCKDADTLAAYLNLGSKQEWAYLAYYGVEGDTYEMVDGKPVYTDKILNNPDGLAPTDAMTKFCFRSAGMYIWDRELQTADQKALDAINDVWPSNIDYDNIYMMPNITMTSDEANRYATIMGDVNTYVGEMTTAFILGSEPLENWDSYVESVKGMGIEEAISLQQAALDRFYER